LTDFLHPCHSHFWSSFYGAEITAGPKTGEFHMAMTQTVTGPRQLSMPALIIHMRDFVGRCAERSIMFHDKLRTARLLAQLDSDMLEDIGVPHDQRSLTSGMLNRYPNVIKVQRSSI
jgi:uncharacterized protein YjiS (DUF1127 family)